MRLTKIYLRTWSRVTSFVVGASVAVVAALLAFTLIIDPVSVAADVPLPPAPVSDHEKDQLQDLRILSYSALPGRQPIYYLQGKGGKFTSTELTNKGFNLVVHNKKHISFVKGDYHASAFGN